MSARAPLMPLFMRARPNQLRTRPNCLLSRPTNQNRQKSGNMVVGLVWHRKCDKTARFCDVFYTRESSQLRRRIGKMTERKFTRGLGKPGMAAQLRETVSQVVRKSTVQVRAPLKTQTLAKNRRIGLARSGTTIPRPENGRRVGGGSGGVEVSNLRDFRGFWSGRSGGWAWQRGGGGWVSRVSFWMFFGLIKREI